MVNEPSFTENADESMLTTLSLFNDSVEEKSSSSGIEVCVGCMKSSEDGSIGCHVMVSLLWCTDEDVIS